MRALWAALLAFSLPAAAQQLYKWVDAEGRTRYSDQAPKGFTGKVEKLEKIDYDAPTAPTVPSALQPKAAPVVDPRKAAPVADMAKTRRATRERLQADIDSAEERLVQAKAALEGSRETRDDERQTIRQPANMYGTLPAAKRANCRAMVGLDGRSTIMCPAVIPNEVYYDRIKGLEDAVRQAELDLDRAKEAYRRGTD